MKRLLSVIGLAVLLLGVFVGQAVAQDTAELYINGQYLRTDTRPLLVEGATFVPLRTVGSALGAEVSWQNSEAVILLGDKSIILKPNSRIAVVNGQNMQLATAPRLQEGRIMIPLRFVSEQLGAQVDYRSYGYARNVVDITLAAGSRLPVNSGFAGAVEDDQYIYLADSYIYRFDKQSGEQTKLPIGMVYPYKLCLADGCLYYSRSKHEGTNTAGHKLYRYDLAAGEETMLLDGAYRPYRYGDWLYYLNTPDYSGTLYRVRLTDDRLLGQPEKLLDEVFDYWLQDDNLYYNMWNYKFFKADLAGGGSQKLALTDDVARQAYDAGYFYGLGRGPDNDQILYRFKAGEAKPYLLEDFSQVTMNSKPFDSIRVNNIKVYGNIMYFNTQELAEYMPNHSGNVTGPLYARKVDGGRGWQLTKEKALVYYVLRDKILYQTQVYDEQGQPHYPWRMLDNDLQDVFG